MSSPAATSSSHYCILDSKEAHNHFSHTNHTAKLRNYILEPCLNHINLTLNQNITPTDLNLLRTAIGCASWVVLIETIKKLKDSIVDITSIIVNRDVDMLLLSKPTRRPKLETSSIPSLPSSAKVSEPRTPITINYKTTMMNLVRDFIKKKLNTTSTLDRGRAWWSQTLGEGWCYDFPLDSFVLLFFFISTIYIPVYLKQSGILQECSN